MNEICKCGKWMKFIKSYSDGDFEYYEYYCEKCDKTKKYQVCCNCENEMSWWE